MRKTFASLVLALVLVLTCITGALAEDLLLVTGELDSDVSMLYVTVSTEFPELENLNFTASTENGELEVVGISALRDLGTSWFVIVDFSNNAGNYQRQLFRTEMQFLQKLGDIVQPIDAGRVVTVDANPTIGIEQMADSFRSALGVQPLATDSHYLDVTMRRVFQYIRENRGDLKQNVAVVVVTAGNITQDSDLTTIGSTLRSYSDITTHIVAFAPENNDLSAWHNRATSLITAGEERLYEHLAEARVNSKDLTENDASDAADKVYQAE